MIKHEQMVTKLCKCGTDIVGAFTEEKAKLVHHTLGISGEVGELVDAVKRNFIYNKELDRQNIIEELGDIEFYLEGFRQVLNITREETLQANINKLSVRYKDFNYTDKQAHERADKK